MWPVFPARAQVHITALALGEKASPGQHTIKINYGGQEFVLGTLDSERGVYQVALDTVLERTATFINTGKTPVYLTGYKTTSSVGEYEDFDEEFSEEGSSEEEDEEEAPMAVPLQQNGRVGGRVGGRKAVVAARAGDARPAAVQQTATHIASHPLRTTLASAPRAQTPRMPRRLTCSPPSFVGRLAVSQGGNKKAPQLMDEDEEDSEEDESYEADSDDEGEHCGTLPLRALVC